nr:hypothetical protein [Fredinandcohnia onubensis]
MSKVVTWYMTPEELAEYREKYPPKTDEEIKARKKRKSPFSDIYKYGERRKRGKITKG